MADATAILNEISGALDSLANAVTVNVGVEQSFMEAWNWQQPAINKYEFADLIRSPTTKIQRLQTKEVSEEDFRNLSQVPARIQFYVGNVLPNLPGGNSYMAFMTAKSLIDQLNSMLDRYLPAPVDLAKLDDPTLIPATQLRRLQTIKKNIDRLSVDSAELAPKVIEIQSAYEMAQNLPTTRAELEDAQAEFAKATVRLREDIDKVGGSKDAASKVLDDIKALQTEAQAVMKNIDEAYSAATTQGLGKAFADKARTLKTTTWVLFGALLLTLAGGGYITWLRVEWVHMQMANPKFSVDMVWANVVLTIASVAGPIWFAWILTKQIGQRFRLDEDYDYKASVAKAYEGYRREAKYTDPEQSKRLLALAVDRLSEEPLRHIERHTHGSPINELAAGIFGRKRDSTPSKGA